MHLLLSGFYYDIHFGGHFDFPLYSFSHFVPGKLEVGRLLKLVCHSNCLAPIILFTEYLHKIKHLEFNHKYFYFVRKKN